MKNQVIKVLNKEHGKKVIQFWKDRGVDVDSHKGVSNEADYNMCIYYGVINGRFDNWDLRQVQLYNADIIELPKEDKPIFKVGDKVFDYAYGWGEVVDISESENDKHPIQVDFLSDMTEYYNNKGSLFNKTNMKTLSFTGYTLQGFSQERPIELPEVGELCLFYDHGWKEEDYQCGLFKEYEKGNTHPYRTTDDDGYQVCKRIKILD